MPFFNYKARNNSGQMQKGKVEAASIDRAAETLQERGFFVISIEPIVENVLTAFSKRAAQMSFSDTVTFTRQLASMVEAGLTLTMSLALLTEQAKPSVGIVLNQILNDLEGGLSFSKSLEKHPKVFPKTYVYLVQAGESSGSLDLILNRLADTMDEQKDFKGKIKGALIYPIAVLLVMLVVGIVMMVAVIPKLLEVFQEFGAELPLPTRILIAVSNFFTNFWWVILLIIGVGVFAFLSWYRSREAKKIVDRLIFKIPIFGDLRKKTILTSYTQTLAMLIKAGIPLVESLKLSLEAINSINYRDELKVVGEKVEKGVALGTAIAIYDDFPPIMSQMIRVGEETGKLDDILLRLSRYFKGDSERAVSGLMAAFEPFIMVLLGVVVAFLVIAVIMPIYDLTNQISG